VHPVRHDLAAVLHRPAVGKELLLYAPTRPLARLEHGDVGAARRQVARRGQACEPRSHHYYVVL
jgi:hypothetical protein